MKLVGAVDRAYFSDKLDMPSTFCTYLPINKLKVFFSELLVKIGTFLYGFHIMTRISSRLQGDLAVRKQTSISMYVAVIHSKTN